MPRYYVRDNEKYMFKNVEIERKNLYHIMSEIGVSEAFLWRHADWIDESNKEEEKKKREFIQEKINIIESKGGKTNYYDMYEMYGRVHNLWSIIAGVQKLPESFIEKYSDKFRNCWRTLCERQNLSEDFMRRNLDKLDWWAVAHFQKYSENFYFEFFENINEKAKYQELIQTKEYLRPKNLTNKSLILLLKMNGYTENGEN
jgi:hypothetical protein